MVRDSFYAVEDVEMKVFFPKGFNNSNLSVSMGDFDFNTTNGIATWKINRFDKDNNNIKMIGNLMSNNPLINNVNGNCTLDFKGIIERYSISGGRVTKVTITKNTKNLNIYKGEKSKTVIKNLEISF
jgi:hypothetical protein